MIEELKRLEQEAAEGPWTGEVTLTFTDQDAALIVALRNAAPALIAVAEAAEGIVKLDRPYRLNDEGCRAALEELLLKIKVLDAALRALRGGEGEK